MSAPKLLAIYGLVDPTGPELIYVGCTSQMRKRLRDHNDGGYVNHVMKERVRAILDAGLRLTYVTLELTMDKKRECEWMAFFEGLGIPLLNKRRSSDLYAADKAALLSPTSAEFIRLTQIANSIMAQRKTGAASHTK